MLDAARVPAIILSVIALVWFTLPVLRGTYTEGFEPTIGINADGLLNGRTQNVDLLYPFNGRFFLLTRLGSAIVLAAMRALDHLPMILNFRAIMLASLVLLVGSAVYILARVYRVYPVFAALACLMFPPIFESAYLFNDNVLSAGLSTLALALFWTRLTLPATAGAAVLLGLAATTRPDALFVVPAFAVLMWFELPDLRTRLRHALVAAPIVAVIPLATYAAFGFSYFDIFAVAPRAIALWDRHQGLLAYVRHAIYGLALPGMIILPLGLGSFVVHRRWREVCLCILVPLLYFCAYGVSLFELRYLLPLTPFLVIAFAEGARTALRSTGIARLALTGAFALAIAGSVAPLIRLPYWRLSALGIDADGPRPIIGRVWSPLVWSLWLGDLNGGVAALDDTIEREAQPGKTLLVVSAHWNPDRLFDLLLLEHGFTPQPDALPGACRSMAEKFTRQGATVIHVRAHLPFVRRHRESVTWLEGGLPCVRELGLDHGDALVLGWRPADFQPTGLDPAAHVDEIYRPAAAARPAWLDPALRRNVTIIWRAPVAAIVAFLPQPSTPQEKQAAEDVFRNRLRLLK